MKTLKKYEEVIMNYFNGNLTDFSKDLKRLTKKELLTLESLMSTYFSPPDYSKANNAIFKHLD